MIYFIIGLIVGAAAIYAIMHNMLRRETGVYKDLLRHQREDSERERSRDLLQLKESYETQIKLLSEQLKMASQEMIKNSGRALLDSNQMQMNAIIDGLQKQMQRIDSEMKESNERTIKASTKVEERIKDMLEHTQSLGQQAERLSNALRRNNKVAGNWGELILSELLESQGLKRGLHFEEQATMRDAAGVALRNDETSRRMMPDVILHLADNRDVIIDSKMSLQAFIEYQNAGSDELRRDAAKRHVASLREHVRGLSGKNYAAYVHPPKVSTDFVLMFVPIEGALQLAMAEDPNLWREAFDKKVFIVGAQTLTAALRIIDLTWVNVLQERNTQKVMDEARKLIDRVNGFLTDFESLGRKIEETDSAYRRVIDRARDGRQSILSSGRRLEELGVRGKHPLPSSTDD